MRIELAAHLPKIRKTLSMTQAEFGELCGISRTRVSQIETGTIPMTWSQLVAIVYMCYVNRQTKEYFYEHDMFGPRFLQFMQRKDELSAPETNIPVRDELAERYRARVTAGANV